MRRVPRVRPSGHSWGLYRHEWRKANKVSMNGNIVEASHKRGLSEHSLSEQLLVCEVSGLCTWNFPELIKHSGTDVLVFLFIWHFLWVRLVSFGVFLLLPRWTSRKYCHFQCLNLWSPSGQQEMSDTGSFSTKASMMVFCTWQKHLQDKITEIYYRTQSRTTGNNVVEIVSRSLGQWLGFN